MQEHFTFRHLNLLISLLSCILMTGCGMSFNEAISCGMAAQGEPGYNIRCMNERNRRIDAENLEIELHNSATRESWKDTQLHKAVFAGDIGTVKTLIAKGQDVNARGAYGRTPLHVAADGTNIEIVELLLLNGADVNAIDNFKATPLNSAVEYMNDKYIKIAKILIQYGADIELKDSSGRKPLQKTYKDNQKAIAGLLEAEALSASVEKRSGTPLHDAVKDNDQFMVEDLISKGVYINRKDSKGNTPLHYAAVLKGSSFYIGKPGPGVNNGEEMVKLLLAKGADAGITNNEDKTPLQLAVENSMKKTAALLKAAADSKKSKEMIAMEKGYSYLVNKQFSEAEKEYTYVIGEARTLGESLKSPTEKKKSGQAEAAFKYLHEYMLLLSLHNRAAARSGLGRYADAVSDWQEVIRYYETNGCTVNKNDNTCMIIAEAAYMNSCSMKYGYYVAEPSTYRNYFEEADRECSEALKIDPTDKLAKKIKEEIKSEKEWADALDGMLKDK